MLAAPINAHLAIFEDDTKLGAQLHLIPFALDGSACKFQLDFPRDTQYAVMQSCACWNICHISNSHESDTSKQPHQVNGNLSGITTAAWHGSCI